MSITKKPKIEVYRGLGYDSNIYLIEGEVLIDAGTGHAHDVFMSWLRQRTDPLDIHTLILTHRHYDHTGGAVNILEETGAVAYIHADDAPPVMNGDEVTTGARSFQGEQIPIHVIPIEQDHIFEIGEHRFEVIWTPGHSIGSISLFCRGNGILFPGDVFFVNGGIGRWDLPTGDYNSLKTSIEKIVGLVEDLESSDIYPGHDVPIIGKGKEHAELALVSIRQNPMDLMMRRLEFLKK